MAEESVPIEVLDNDDIVPARALAALPASTASEAAAARVRSEIEAKLHSYTPRLDLDHVTPDVLNGKYRIDVTQPLPEYSHGDRIKTYAVTGMDGTLLPLYAAITNYDLPYRHTTLEKMQLFDHEYLLRVETHGVSHISILGAQRHVAVFQKPSGPSLSQSTRDGLSFTEARLTKQILAPIAGVLNGLHEMGTSHCHIHPDNMFVGSRIVLGECVTLPAGYAQELIYEPIERITASRQGKGGGSIKVDLYSLGVMALDLLFGLEKMRQLPPDQLISLLLAHGSYNVLSAGHDISEHYQDFLRGVLFDNPADRWGATELSQWLTGKRYNIIHPSTPREASRPFTFEEKDYFNRKALANAFFLQWETARNFIRSGKLERWLEQSIQEPETTDLLQSAIVATGGVNTKSNKRNNELLSRTLCLIDPSGPLRMDKIAFNVDGLGKMLCDVIFNKRQAELGQLAEILQIDLPNYWADRQKSRLGTEINEALMRIQNVRVSLANPTFGFGVERCMYDLNHDLPCYSDLLKGYYVADLKTLLLTLDALCKKNPSGISLLDRHIAAFIASRTNVVREIRFPEIASASPELAASNELKMFSLIAKAQEMTGLAKLRGLTAYAGLRALDMLENVHSKRIRESFVQKVKDAVNDGDMANILLLMLDRTSLDRDRKGFLQAQHLYRRNLAEILLLRDKANTRRNTKERGKRWALAISSFALLITCASVLSRYIHR